MTDLSAIRDEVCRRADIRALALQAGFREVPRRPKALRCIHGEDRNPSARFYAGRLKCDSCQRSWSPLDLVMLRDGVAFMVALRTLAAETGVPMPNLSAGEVAELRARRERARSLAVDIADWATAMQVFADQWKADLVALLHWALELNLGALVALSESWLEDIPAWALRPADHPQVVARAYRAVMLAAPDAADRMRAKGESERMEFEQLTARLMATLREPGQRSAAA
jgi:hypothetical protein